MNGLFKFAALSVAACLALAVLFPTFVRQQELRRLPERHNRFLNVRFIKIQRRGDQVVLTPGKFGYRDQGTSTYKPMVRSIGSKLNFYGACWAPKYTIVGIEADGVVVSYVPVEGHTTKLRWK